VGEAELYCNANFYRHPVADWQLLLSDIVMYNTLLLPQILLEHYFLVNTFVDEILVYSNSIRLHVLLQCFEKNLHMHIWHFVTMTLRMYNSVESYRLLCRRQKKFNCSIEMLVVTNSCQTHLDLHGFAFLAGGYFSASLLQFV
jgi:hypothetical protein